MRAVRKFEISNLPPIAEQSLWGRGTVVAATVDEGILSISLTFTFQLAGSGKAACYKTFTFFPLNTRPWCF